jgi:nicotinamidase-related amidase
MELHFHQDSRSIKSLGSFPRDKRWTRTRIYLVTKTFRYSGFEGTNLNVILKDAGIKRVFVVGYVTEYCVKATALDAVKNGYETIVVGDLCAAVNPVNAVKAVDEMKKEGIKFE